MKHIIFLLIIISSMHSEEDEGNFGTDPYIKEVLHKVVEN